MRNQVRGRFAPSPSGRMHLGGATFRLRPHREDGTVVYDGHCRTLSPEQRSQRGSDFLGSGSNPRHFARFRFRRKTGFEQFTNKMTKYTKFVLAFDRIYDKLK